MIWFVLLYLVDSPVTCVFKQLLKHLFFPCESTLVFFVDFDETNVLGKQFWANRFTSLE